MKRPSPSNDTTSDSHSDSDSLIESKPSLESPPSSPSSSTPSPKNRKKSKAASSAKKKPANQAQGDKPAKTRWTAEEDDILIGMIEELVKEHIWAKVRADGRLVHRTSYGCQYHANMLLRQGTGKGPTTPSKGK